MAEALVWTDKKLAKLKELWEKGLSISQIGEKLDVSRNSVAGKVHRLGLPKRQSPISDAEKAKSGGRKINAMDDMKAEDLPLKLALRKINWSHSKCSWPIGEPDLPTFRFCGEEVVAGKPYCNEHCFEAYTTRDSGTS